MFGTKRLPDLYDIAANHASEILSLKSKVHELESFIERLNEEKKQDQFKKDFKDIYEKKYGIKYKYIGDIVEIGECNDVLIIKHKVIESASCLNSLYQPVVLVSKDPIEIMRHQAMQHRSMAREEMIKTEYFPALIKPKKGKK